MHAYACIFTRLFLILYGKFFAFRQKTIEKIYANVCICVYFCRSEKLKINYIHSTIYKVSSIIMNIFTHKLLLINELLSGICRDVNWILLNFFVQCVYEKIIFVDETNFINISDFIFGSECGTKQISVSLKCSKDSLCDTCRLFHKNVSHVWFGGCESMTSKLYSFGEHEKNNGCKIYKESLMWKYCHELTTGQYMYYMYIPDKTLLIVDFETISSTFGSDKLYRQLKILLGNNLNAIKTYISIYDLLLLLKKNFGRTVSIGNKLMEGNSDEEFSKIIEINTCIGS